MSIPFRPTRSPEVRTGAECMCAHGSACSSFAPGHALHLIQARLAAATPSDWADAVVSAVDARRGEITLVALDDGELRRVWSASGAASRVRAGEPVALHDRYRVLAVGRELFNVEPRI